MTIINSKDLDAQMGRTVDPKSIPTHNGGDHGVMEERFLAQSDTIETQQGHGQRGATVVDGKQVPDSTFYGSQTIISVSEAPPLIEAHEPKVVEKPRTIASILAAFKIGPKK